MRKYELLFYKTLSDFRKGVEHLKPATVQANSFEAAEKEFYKHFGKVYMIFSNRLLPIESDNQRP
jgi:hypothetical protein